MIYIHIKVTLLPWEADHISLSVFNTSLLGCFLGCCLLWLGGLLGLGCLFLLAGCLGLLGRLGLLRCLLLLRCLGFLGSGLGLLGFLGSCLGLLGLLGLDCLLLSAELEAAGSSSSLGLFQGTILHTSTESHLQMLVDDALIFANIEVLGDVLEDGLAGGTSPLLQGSKGLGDHLRVFGMICGLLGLGGLLLGALGRGGGGRCVCHGYC